MNEKQKQLILETLNIEEAIKECEELHTELGVALGTGTLIKGEAENLTHRMAELMCIAEYLKILQGDKADE